MQNVNFSIWRVLSNAYTTASQWVMRNDATNVAIGPIAWAGTTAALARGEEMLPSRQEIHVLQPSEKEVQEVRALPTQRKMPDLRPFAKEERDSAPVVSVASDVACCMHRTLPTLEMQFMEEITSFGAEDIEHRPGNWPTQGYLSPNEENVLEVQSHLVMKKPGKLVCTGAERSLFNLILADPTKCEGLVVVDFDPLTKAYLDFNVLLLRISRNMEHYAQLSSLDARQYEGSLTVERYHHRYREINTAIETSDLPPALKEYYKKNLIQFGSIYYNARKTSDWRTSAKFNGVKYHEDERLFQRVQQYAKSGNIIVTKRDINDLKFLDNNNIEILDISNIPDYFIPNFQTNSTPRVIATKLRGWHFEYQSYSYTPLTPHESATLGALLDSAEFSRKDAWENSVPPFYSRELLNYMSGI